MTKLVTLVLTLALLVASTAATAATLYCFVDTPANDPFTPEYCSAVVPGARSTTAVFRVYPPGNYQVLWSDPRCDPSHPAYDYVRPHDSRTCSVTITLFEEKTMEATVLNLDNNTSFQVSATAYFEPGW